MPDAERVLSSQPTAPNPRRVEAGRRNARLRRSLTEVGRQRLRDSILRFQPWQFAVPKSAAARKQSAKNGKSRQIGILSVRESRALAATVTAGLTQARQFREAALRDGEKSP